MSPRPQHLALTLPLLLVACIGLEGPTELGNFGIGDTLLEQSVAVPAAFGGPQAGQFDGVTFTLEQSAAVLVLANHGTFQELRSAGMASNAANNTIEDRPLGSMPDVAAVYGVAKKTMEKLRAFAPTWPGLQNHTPPEPATGEVSFQLTAAVGFTVTLTQTTANPAEISVTAGSVTTISERSSAPRLTVPVSGGPTNVVIVVRNYAASILNGTLKVTSEGTQPASGLDVLFTNPLCNDVSVQGAKVGARCTGTEKDASREQAGIWARIIGMMDAARVYKQQHPEAPVTIYMSYLSWYYDGGMLNAVKAALDAGVQFRGYFDSHGDVGMPEALEALNHPNVHLGWLGGHTDNSGTWRLMHIKLTMVDFGVDSEPTQLVFSSANLSPSGSSIHFENFVFANVPRQSNFAQRHLCAIQALEADRYPSRFETDDHEVIFESHYDACVAQIQAPVDPHMQVFFSPDAGGWSQAPDSALGFVVGQMNAATTSLDMAIEHFSERSVGQALRGPQSGGGNVTRRLVLDDQTLYMDGESSEGDNLLWWSLFSQSWAQQRVAQRFLRTNADIHQLQHNKYVIIDGRGVFCGAGNFTGAAFSDNYENFYYFDDATVVGKFQTHFNHMFNDLGSTLAEIPAPKHLGADQ